MSMPSVQMASSPDPDPEVTETQAEPEIAAVIETKQEVVL